MTFEEILSESREIWGDSRCDLNSIITLLGVVYGDLCRQSRRVIEGEEIERQVLSKEAGNVIVSMIRWIDDLGLDLGDCINQALECQRRYQEG